MSDIGVLSNLLRRLRLTFPQVKRLRSGLDFDKSINQVNLGPSTHAYVFVSRTRGWSEKRYSSAHQAASQLSEDRFGLVSTLRNVCGKVRFSLTVKVIRGGEV